jgi:hypothetical protein
MTVVLAAAFLAGAFAVVAFFAGAFFAATFFAGDFLAAAFFAGAFFFLTAMVQSPFLFVDLIRRVVFESLITLFKNVAPELLYQFPN